jgi:hypothetical protein
MIRVKYAADMIGAGLACFLSSAVVASCSAVGGHLLHITFFFCVIKSSIK